MAQSLSNLPVGAKVKFGKYSVNGEAAQNITWLIVAKNHSSTPAYPTNSVTLLTEKVIDIRALDAREPNNTQGGKRDSFGNNRYSVSNLDQWLNKSETSWYVARHAQDQSPTNDYTGGFGTGYDTRPGFLNAFSSNEINAILNTTIRASMTTSIDGAEYEDITRKVFVPSISELGFSHTPSDGTLWEYFTNNSRLCTLTTQAYTYSLCTQKPSANEKHYWWLRSADGINGWMSFSSFSEENISSWNAMTGKVGVRPALNLSSSFKVSDSTDSDGCYTAVWNSAPPAPSTITVPASIYGGKSTTISWSGVTDPDGNSVTYQLEYAANGGSYTQLYSGTALSYAHVIPFGTNTVTYRVKATDTALASSTYTTSATRTVVNNNAPAISGTDANLGTKSSGFTGKYTITDANGNSVTVTEAIDGKQIRAFSATLGTEVTYSVTGNTWLGLSNGSHTLTITATDGLDTTVRTYTFTKSVNTLKIQNATPWAATTKPSRIMLVVTRNVPSPATFKVEVCNNGYDSSPTWEDATAAVLSGLVHVFTNTTKTATNWGVRFRITVARNGATGACYISAIGGNFE